MKRPLAYITAPWSKNPHENAANAASYCRQVYDAGYSPVCPVLFLPLFLKDEIPQEHKDGIDIARDFHNHIIWNAVNLNCDRKFRNFWGSTRAVRRLNDTICVENGYSIVEDPKPHGKSYNKTLSSPTLPLWWLTKTAPQYRALTS
ncbi:relaxase/mobilization nuclease domain-containing protein [Flintibacter muris]|uniref:DUF7768 domain-containing protein n=1 Tax=Flintibacter muris TaxID=2941327 RepID=UPI00203F88B7|nr:relaxase/mobilization nuclease domain-containing protein [Flintibacter muris]